MNANFKTRLLQHLSQKNKKDNKGFTLIELLVVVIIIGVLAAVALPNLLAQVGKARESEGKTGVGTIVRAQQTFHFEAREFADGLDNASFTNINSNPLGLAVISSYYEFGSGINTASFASATAAAPGSAQNGVRTYGGGISFDSSSGSYNNILCQSQNVQDAAPNMTAVACPGTSRDIQ